MNRYRSNICLLDATYKTTRYFLPLLFLALKANADYQEIGSFVIQDKTTQSMKEALNVLKKRNALWNPKILMTDNCNEGFDVIENLFSHILNQFLSMIW